MEPSAARLVPTGIEGLDEVLYGGLDRSRTYLVEGRPGAGKTTLALQWLLDGVARGERCLHVSLSETADELHATMASHGWKTHPENLSVVTMNIAKASLQREAQYTMYHPAEVELGETVERILAEVERVDPARVVVDSLSEIRLLSQDPLTYRRQVLALKQFLADRECTALLVSQELPDPHQAGLHSLVHGVVSLRQTTLGFGATHRQLQVMKMRGRAFAEGTHSFTIGRGGIRVFARPRPAGATAHERTVFASGTEGLDALLGGGPVRGTSTLFMGPTGTGKSSVMSQYVAAALERGQGVAIFAFDERRDVFLDRSAGLGLDLARHLDEGRLSVQQVDPGQLSPGEFAHHLREAVEGGAELVAIDSLNGFISSMPEERFLLIHLHELLDFLASHAATTIMTLTQPSAFGSGTGSSVNASYLSDAIVLFRYFESRGEVRKAMSVLKKRLGGHERAIRELHVGPDGVEVGEPLHEFQGIMSGSGMPHLHETADRRADHDADA